jgi:hypothetical protein
MVRTEVLTECGVFDPSLPYSEDWDIWLRIARKYQFLKLKRSTTLYRQHPKQGSKKARPIDYRANLIINAKQKWGLSSPDGNSLSDRQFIQNLAYFH